MSVGFFLVGEAYVIIGLIVFLFASLHSLAKCVFAFEGLRGGHANGEELTLDLHGALKTALTSRPSDAASVGDAIGLLLKHAPYISELDVGGAPLGVAGIGPIATALGESKSLAHLGLAAINLGERADEDV